MDPVIEFKTQSIGEPHGNADQERAYQRTFAQDCSGSAERNELICISCGARAKSGADLSCGH